MILADSTVLPDNAGYVAAAYLVFLALLVIYVGIMAYKLMNLQRDVAEIGELADRALGGDADGPPASAPAREETPA
ncbi:MAG TPA: hypothetical protein VNT03_12970 [Baekduia sp.]|nr:hypothetical protein [Baekduia sp.]